MEIQGHESYLIYDDGRVYSKKSNRFMKITIGTNGYKYIQVGGRKHKKNFYIHRLIAIHYISNPHNYPCVDHIDRNPLNNDISNLRWCSHIQNMTNFGLRNTNTSGHSNIGFNKQKNKWVFQKGYLGKYMMKRFKNKTDALCYKYIILLRIKAGHFDRLNS